LATPGAFAGVVRRALGMRQWKRIKTGRRPSGPFHFMRAN